MLALTSAHRYLLRKAPTDMRKGFDTLCGLVRDELGRDPLSGEVFVFISGGRNRIKLLLYEGGGFVLWYKRLEKGTIELPQGDGAVRLTWRQLVLMLEGIALEQPGARVRWKPAPITTHC
ncbi:MAG TPA: IS66 family insertion sequence element accessory protein TnpB [Burkholderiaceae bacterium]|nr:IS66 family insertion sequence element accessory protein TnpB [Burkholderiaceae bacterium]